MSAARRPAAGASLNETLTVMGSLRAAAEAEQAGRLEDEDEDEDREIDDLLEVWRDVIAGQAVDDADDHGAEKGAVHAAHAAEHDDDEGGQHEIGADGRRHRE